MKAAAQLCIFLYSKMRGFLIPYAHQVHLLLSVCIKRTIQAARGFAISQVRASREKWRRVWWYARTSELNWLGKILVPLWFAFGGRKGVAVLLIISLAVSNLWWYRPHTAEAATYTWTQTDWSGGPDGGTRPNHASNQSGWTKYESASTTIATSTSLTIIPANGTTTQTTDTDFNAGTYSNQTQLTGSGAGAGVKLITSSVVPPGTWDTPAITPIFPTLGATMAYTSAGDIFMTPNATQGNIPRMYSITTNTWTSKATAPAAFSSGSVAAYSGSGDFIYVFRGNITKDFFRYSISGNSWSNLASSSVNASGTGDAMVHPGGNFIYATHNGTAFHRYTISTDTWDTSLAAAPATPGQGADLVYPGSGDYIYLLRGNNTSTLYRYSISGDSWTTLAAAPANIPSGGAMVYPGSGDYLYATRGNNTADFYRYSISGNVWSNRASSSDAILFTTGADLVYPGSGDYIYATQGQVNSLFLRYSISGDEWSPVTQVVHSGGTGSANNTIVYPGSGDFLYVVQALNQKGFSKFSLSTKIWTTLTTVPYNIFLGGGIVSTLGDFIYAMGGATNSTKDFMRYSISGNSWAIMASTTAAINSGGSIAYPGSGDFLYALMGVGKDFYRYSISGNSWTPMASTSAATSDGADLLSLGSGDFLYALRGNSSKDFYRYSISGNSWSNLASTTVNVLTGGKLGYPGSGDFLYAFTGNNSKDFYRYSISGNSWTTLASTSENMGGGDGFAYVGDNYLYAISGNSTKGFYRYALTGTTLTPPGDFTSSIIDFGQGVTPTNFSYSSTSPSIGVGTVKFQLRSAATSGGIASATYHGPTGTGDFYTSPTTTVNTAEAGNQFIQYKAILDTTNDHATPILNDVTIAYQYYPATSTLTSSAFNTQSAANVLAKIAWSETLPAGTDIKFQVRTAPDSSGSPGTFTGWVGPDGTSNTYFTDPSGGETIPSALSDGSNDQWIQYKVFLTSAGTASPSLNDVTVTYVVNSAPDFNPNYPTTGAGGVAAVQNSDGTITINYSVRDIDSTAGTITPGFITPSFQYSLDGGSTWTTVSTSTLVASDYTNKSVDQVTYTNYSATWSVTTQFTGTYDTDAKIKVIANDNEAANNTASSTSAVFTLDTKTPAGTSIKVDASQSPALLTLAATDDSTLQMKVGTASNLSGSSYETFNTSKTLSMTDGQSAYAQFKDAYGNATAIISATPPTTPANMYFTDISNPGAPSYAEFIAWNVIPAPTPGFKRYNIYRSVDGGSFTLVSTQTDRLTNYYADFSLSSASTYAYKVTSQDNNDNISFFSATTPIDTPDGNGGSAASPPTISAVTSTAVTPTTATITWTTVELADSKVYYKASASFPGTLTTDYTSSVAVPSMLTSHSVTLSNLTPNTQYFFLVQSTDPNSNATTSASASYTFTTQNGPSISNVVAAQVFDTSAAITWNTDVSSDSTVTYSTNANLTSPTTNTSATATTNHSVTITGLSPATKYYFYVSSQSGGVTTDDKNIVSGVPQYYSFNTSVDTTPPVISSVSTALISDAGATITWSTNEDSTSQVEWGTTTGLGTYTASSTAYSQSHSVILTGLSSSTAYYYRVMSSDHANNFASNDNGGSRYTFTTGAGATTTTVTVTETVTNTVYVGGGGGGGYVDNRDLTKPVISDVKVNAVSGDSAYISFITSKVANGIVDYGLGTSYGKTAGDTSTYSVSHTITLAGLAPETTYHFKATASDVYKNTGDSADFTFTTLAAGEGVHTVHVADDSTANPSTRRAQLFSLVDTIISVIADQNISEDALSASLQELVSRAVAAPVVSGTDITVHVTARTATIRWTTDKSSNSLISYAAAADFQPDATKPYTITAGATDDKVTAHEVMLHNLDPRTTYHFQVRSESAIGLSALSKDSTFTTLSLVPDIVDARFESVGEDGATARWTTGIPTRTLVELVNTATGATQKSAIENYLTDHTFTAQGLDFSTPYALRLTAIDADGNASHPLALPFTTVLSSEAPTISGVRISTSLVPGRIETAQTIISWRTDKPATSRVLFAEGGGEFKQLGTPDQTLVRDHVVISTFLKPGTVYKLKVESGSSGGALVQSQLYTILTAKPNASVVDLIFSGLNQTFGFLKAK